MMIRLVGQKNRKPKFEQDMVLKIDRKDRVYTFDICFENNYSKIMIFYKQLDFSKIFTRKFGSKICSKICKHG
eukprot:TRINITY_DN6802_c0_g1_i1.p2 TRINITY_DN6802_c0_g1~~TRINITY_DN6802_c0_g1_i1.p2  ORF type:complete len:73 (+),score=5.69 TRINITY_DN6802_c0_g1_i1:442-660(+)